jgi:AraC-like DNA-binding protein
MLYLEPTFHLFLKTALVIVCFVLALVFLNIPLPSSEKFRNYRRSLSILTAAYFMIALIFTLSMIINLYNGLFSFIVMMTAAIQTLLFELVLLLLYNPKYVTKQFVYKFSIPLVAFIVLYTFFAINSGIPDLKSFKDFYQYWSNPTVIIRLLLLLFYAFELIYFSIIILQQEQIYKLKLDTYFADNFQLQLSWVKYYFFIALINGVLVFISSFNTSAEALAIFRVFYILFFIVFGIRFIQYKQIFKIVEPALDDSPIERNTHNYLWTEMKNKVLAQKFYLKENVTIEEMASFLKVGRTKLSNCINKEENMHFNLWINTLRIEDAKSLFKENRTISILQVSEIVGYTEQSNFSKQFKKITGKSPSVWRNEEV